MGDGTVTLENENGPALKLKRSYFGCSIFKTPLAEYIIIVGGEDTGVTELLRLDQPHQLEWQPGKTAQVAESMNWLSTSHIPCPMPILWIGI